MRSLVGWSAKVLCRWRYVDVRFLVAHPCYRPSSSPSIPIYIHLVRQLIDGRPSRASNIVCSSPLPLLCYTTKQIVHPLYAYAMQNGQLLEPCRLHGSFSSTYRKARAYTSGA